MGWNTPMMTNVPIAIKMPVKNIMSLYIQVSFTIVFVCKELPRGPESLKVFIASLHKSLVDVAKPDVMGEGEGESYGY